MTSIVVILWMLSLITEKIVNSIKLNTKALREPEYSTPRMEKRREKKIQRLSIITGMLVALISQANFFLFFKNQEKMDLTFRWEYSDFFPLDLQHIGDLFYHALGCSITGLFLSFGSKFFHDLLDILLQYKNIKRKIAEREDWNFESIEQVEGYLKSQESGLIHDFLKKELLNKYPDVVTFEFVPETWQVRVYSSAPEKLPKSLYYKTSLGKVKTIVVAAVKSGLAVALSRIEVYPSVTVSNKSGSDQRGTVSCVVRDIQNRLCLLTCYHAVKASEHGWDGIDANSTNLEVALSPGQPPIGKIIKGYRDETLDVALILPNENVDLFTGYRDNSFNFLEKSRMLYGDDETQNTKVWLKSAMRNKVLEGKITALRRSVNIKYQNDPFGMDGLFEITGIGQESFAVEGDSGCIVVDKDGYALGMIVSGMLEENRSYAIPITYIEEQLKIQVV